MEGLVILAIVVVLAGPVLAIMALVAVRRLDGESSNHLIPQLTSRIFVLEQRLSELEKTLRQASPLETSARTVEPPAHPSPEDLSDQIRVSAPIPAVPGPRIPPPPREAPLAPVISSGAAPADALHGIHGTKKASPLDLESLIAGRWFNRIGIVALLIAVSYFLKFAFDNNWIGQSGRVAIGVLLGALMLPWSQWLLGKGYTYFSEGIAALGEATLFLSAWAGCQYYTLYSRDVGFAAMIAITAAMAAVAIGRNSQRIAVLSLLGGLLTPVLASSGKDQQVVLFTYLILLGGGALVIASKKDWKWLAPIAFVGTQIYFWGWYSEFFHSTSPLERTVVFATLFYLLYSGLPIAKALRGVSTGELDVALVLLNSFAYSVALFILMWPNDKWPLTLLFLALAAGHVAIARLLPVAVGDGSALALDIAAQFQLRETMRELARSGLAIVLVTHQVSEIIPEIDRVI